MGGWRTAASLKIRANLATALCVSCVMDGRHAQARVADPGDRLVASRGRPRHRPRHPWNNAADAGGPSCFQASHGAAEVGSWLATALSDCVGPGRGVAERSKQTAWLSALLHIALWRAVALSDSLWSCLPPGNVNGGRGNRRLSDAEGAPGRREENMNITRHRPRPAIPVRSVSSSPARCPAIGPPARATFRGAVA